MYPFPHFRFFPFGTPTIPDIYWNSYSYEERIKKLCFEYAKLITFTDSMVDTVNAQYAMVEDMKDKLPELVDEDVSAELQRLIESGELQDMVREAVDAWADARTEQVDENTQNIEQLGTDLEELSEQLNEQIENIDVKIDTETSERIHADDEFASKLDSMKYDERGKWLLNRANNKSWGAFAVVMNTDAVAPPSPNPYGSNRFFINYGTGDMKLLGNFVPLATASGSSNHWFTIKDGPLNTDIIAPETTYTFRNALFSDHVNTDGVVDRIISRDVDININGQVFSRYNVYADRGCNINGTHRIGTNAGKFNTAFALASENQVISALNNMRSIVNSLRYSDNDLVRFDINRMSSGERGTDCSGAIYRSFKQAGVRIPPNSGPQVTSMGKYVTWCEAGKQLDVSKLKVGDIIGFSPDPLENLKFSHVGMINSVDVENNTYGIIDQSAYNAEGTYYGPTIRDGHSWLADRHKFVVRYWNDPDLE